jgi:hypothetical protein
MTFGGKDSMAEFMGARLISFNYFSFAEFSLSIAPRNGRKNSRESMGP